MSVGTESTILRHWRISRLAVLLAGASAAAACGTLAPQGESVVAKDILEIKQSLARMSDEAASGDRKMEYRLSTLEEKVQARNDLITNNLAEIDKRLREQNDEIRNLRKDFSEIAFQFNSLATKLDMKTAQPSENSAALLSPTAPGETAFDEAQKQFNLGRYDAARDGFKKTVDEGAEGELALRARYWLGESFFKLNDMANAHETYRDLIIANTSHPLAWRSLERLAQIAEHENRPADALRFYQQILTTNPTYEGIERVKERVAALQAQTQAAPAPAPQQPAPNPPPTNP